MKKLLTLLVAAILAVGCCFGLTACSCKKDAEYTGIVKVENKSDLKIGFICLHDKTSTYDANFIEAIEKACEDNGISKDNIFYKTGVEESDACYDAAVELIENNNCNVIFADSFGHEPYMLQAAKKYPNVQFCHATGTKAHTEARGNYHNAFASIYEGRYLAGYAAGLKLMTMTDKADNNKNFKVGYVGAYTYAEVVSGYTSWFLGVRAALTDGYTATMDVQFTGSWYDFDAEKNAAASLIENGCVLISQHADSLGAPTACAEKGVPNVSYNKDTTTMSEDEKIANTYVTASRVNWVPYYNYVFECFANGTEIAYDWTGTLANGAVEIISIGAAAADGTKEKLIEVENKIISGELKVYDVENFTVNEKKLTSYRADVDDLGDYVPETEVIFADSYAEDAIVYFHESAIGFRSAPYFDIQIDGIKLVNSAF